MNYFRTFPIVEYSFGDDEATSLFQDISAYVEMIDSLKDNISFYTYYNIQNEERPDQVAYKLYGSTKYHWMIYLLNDHIRRQGWPLSHSDITERVELMFADTILTTHDEIHDQFLIGQTVTGSISGATGTIVRRNISLGQLTIGGQLTFSSSEVITSGSESLQLSSAENEYDATHHYVDSSGDRIDVDPFDSNPSIYTPITYKDYYIAENDKLKKIKTFKPDVIESIRISFEKSMVSGI